METSVELFVSSYRLTLPTAASQANKRDAEHGEGGWFGYGDKGQTGNTAKPQRTNGCACTGRGVDGNQLVGDIVRAKQNNLGP